MATGLIEIMKRASLDAMENGKPCDLRFGNIVSTNPLKVQITTELIIPEALLIVPKHLTNYKVDVSFSGSTTHDGKTFSTSDSGVLTIKNSLKVGDKVALVRNQGGKVYYILDRV